MNRRGEHPGLQSAHLRAVIEAQVQDAVVLAPGWWQHFAAVGKPMMLALFATLGGLTAYFATRLGWRLAVLIRLRRRNKRLKEKRTSCQGTAG